MTSQSQLWKSSFLNIAESQKLSQNKIQRARPTMGKIGPVDLFKNEKKSWVGIKHWYLNKWIPADQVSVVMTSFSDQFFHYDVINSVIITEVQLLS